MSLSNTLVFDSTHAVIRVLIAVFIFLLLLYFNSHMYVYNRTNGIHHQTNQETECESFILDSNFTPSEYDPNSDITPYRQQQQYDKFYSRNTKVSEIGLSKNMHLPEILSNFGNPCWYEQIPDGFSYLDPSWSLYFTFLQDPAKGGIKDDHLKIFCPVENRLHNGRFTWRLRCFPKFFLIGFPKCGTTDFKAMLTLHPWVYDTLVKEPGFWHRYRLQQNVKRNITLSDYLDLYDQTSDQILHQFISTDGDHREYHPGIFGDYDPKTACEMWISHPAEPSEPRTTSADVLYSIYPEAKLIVMMRDPVDRFISHFRCFNPNASQITGPEFHMNVKREIFDFDICVRKYSVRYCAYSAYGYSKSSLVLGLYEVFLYDWMKIFPQKNFLFIKSEKYFARRKHILAKAYGFLNLDDTIPGWMLTKLEASRPRNHKKRDSRVLNATKELLRKFYNPFNQRLAKLIGSKTTFWHY